MQHALDVVAGGWSAYAGAPGWLAAYWSALLVLDPLAAVLVARRHRPGLVLAPGVLVTDAAANGWAVHALGMGGPLAVAGQAVVAVLALASLALTPRWLRRRP
ncbi:hypothetical protein AB2L27_04530 [Kineococcus sp. LSe6-4]|uniref:Uncharacterized protein n=1 Tax=Kineococcus halophytocola TaxID=3234027 RepID=A0ABV4H0R7_9ACTN